MLISELFKNSYKYMRLSHDIEIGELHNINFSKIASIVEVNQNYYQESGLDSLCQFSESVWSDLVKYKNTVCMDVRLEYFQIWLSVPPMKLSLVQGRHSMLYDWIMRSIGDLNKESDNKYTWTNNIEVLHLFRAHSDSFIRDTFFEFISEWAYCLFYYSFKYNIWHDICRAAMSDLIAFIKEGIFDNDNLLDIRIDALLSIAAWAYLNLEDEAISLVGDFELYLLRGDISDEIKKNIELLLVGSLRKCSDVSVEDRARKALHKYDCILHQHERLQFAVAAFVDVSAIEKNLVLFKKAFEEIHKAVDDVIQKEYFLLRVFDLVAPLIRTVFESKRNDLLINILSGYYNNGSSDLNFDDVLTVLLSHPEGVNYILGRRGGEFSVIDDFSFGDIISFINKSFSISVSLRDSDDNRLTGVDRHGIVDGVALKDYCGKLSCVFNDIGLYDSVSENTPSSMIVIPGSQTPFQSIIMEKCSHVIPLSISLMRPRKDRDIKNVIYFSADNTQYSQIELSTIKSIVKNSNINIHFFVGEGFGVDRLYDEYGNKKWDVIYVSTHYNYMHYEPHSGELILSDDKKVYLSELLKKDVPCYHRRMLFLNVCDGATSAYYSGLARFGMAGLLAKNNQAVVSHLWPINNLMAAVYASIFFANITKNIGMFELYQKTKSVIAGGKGQVLGFLKNHKGVDSLIDRLENQQVDCGEYVNSSSLAFYE